MRERLVLRLHELKAEYEAGQQMLADLEQKQDSLRGTLLRISGAVQVLEEELGRVAEPELPEAAPNGAEHRTVTRI